MKSNKLVYLFTFLIACIAFIFSYATAEAKHKRAPVKPVYAKSTAVPAFVQDDVVSMLDNLEVMIEPELNNWPPDEDEPLTISIDPDDTPHLIFAFDFFTISFHLKVPKPMPVYFNKLVYDTLLSIQLPPPNYLSALS